MAKSRTVTRRVYVTKTRRRKKNGFTIPIAAVLPVAYVGYNGILYALHQSPQVAMEKATKWFTGYSLENGTWSWENLKFGLLPVAGGVIVHKIASKLGVNRALASAGVPWVRI